MEVRGYPGILNLGWSPTTSIIFHIIYHTHVQNIL